jgi:hypothetical protein
MKPPIRLAGYILQQGAAIAQTVRTASSRVRPEKLAFACGEMPGLEPGPPASDDGFHPCGTSREE